MIARLRLAPRAESLLIGLCFAATIGFILACASSPPPRAMPTSRWAGGYNYSFQVPRSIEKAPTRINIVVVQPDRDRESALADRLYARVSRGFSRSMGV